MLLRKAQKGEGSRWKLLLWTAVAALIFGLIGAGELPEDMLRASRNNLHIHKASGDIVFVAIDDASLREVGRWPWPRRNTAKIISNLHDAGAKRTFVDIIINGPSEHADDVALAAAISKAGNVTLPITARFGNTGWVDPDLLPPTIISRNADLGLISVAYNYQNAVWRLDYSRQVGRQDRPVLCGEARQRVPDAERRFHPGLFDRSVIRSDFESVGRPERQVRSARLSPARTSSLEPPPRVIDQYFIPGWGKKGGAYVQIIGAETLKAGGSSYFGWLPALALALLACWAAMRQKTSGQAGLILAGSAFVLLMAPIALEAIRLFVDITPALFAVAIVSTAARHRNAGSSAASSTPSPACRTSTHSGPTRTAATRR